MFTVFLEHPRRPILRVMMGSLGAKILRPVDRYAVRHELWHPLPTGPSGLFNEIYTPYEYDPALQEVRAYYSGLERVGTFSDPKLHADRLPA